MLKLGSWSSVQIHSIILFYHTVSHTHLAASYFQPIRSPLFRTKVSLGVFHPIETSGANQSQSFVCEGDRNDRTKLKSKRNSKTRTIIFKTRTMKRAKNVKFFQDFISVVVKTHDRVLQKKLFRIGVSGRTICSYRPCIALRRLASRGPCTFFCRQHPKINIRDHHHTVK